MLPKESELDVARVVFELADGSRLLTLAVVILNLGIGPTEGAVFGDVAGPSGWVLGGRSPCMARSFIESGIACCDLCSLVLNTMRDGMNTQSEMSTSVIN